MYVHGVIISLMFTCVLIIMTIKPEHVLKQKKKQNQNIDIRHR